MRHRFAWFEAVKEEVLKRDYSREGKYSKPTSMEENNVFKNIKMAMMMMQMTRMRIILYTYNWSFQKSIE